ncbi:MAG TPA: DUF3634 family protein [Polyangiaceae bacterium]|nr:DUF3634 family protein [Polyangiaceae bacterium]
MSPIFVLLLLALVAMPLIVAITRANELFALRISQGRLSLVRGRIPPRLFEDIGDVLRRAGVEKASLRAVSENGRAAVRGDLPAVVMQRLRNTISLWPVAKIRNASMKRSRS